MAAGVSMPARSETLFVVLQLLQWCGRCRSEVYIREGGLGVGGAYEVRLSDASGWWNQLLEGVRNRWNGRRGLAIMNKRLWGRRRGFRSRRSRLWVGCHADREFKT
jgi:hypothetical protein